MNRFSYHNLLYVNTAQVCSLSHPFIYGLALFSTYVKDAFLGQKSRDFFRLFASLCGKWKIFDIHCLKYSDSKMMLFSQNINDF